jgi:hypothetical protein
MQRLHAVLVRIFERWFLVKREPRLKKWKFGCQCELVHSAWFALADKVT